jgi:hypothetical protein
MCQGEAMNTCLWFWTSSTRWACLFLEKTITCHKEIVFFFANVWVHFGLPRFIASKRDSRFFGKFWKTLWVRMDTK